jgi:DNA/RNA-binding domain of Phe-tRNA-synthetase-like protein
MSESIKLRIDGAVFERFAHMGVHAFRTAGTAEAAAKIDAAGLLADARDFVLRHGYHPTKIAETPVVRSWREAYAVGGLQPSKYRSSIEALLRRCLRDGGSLVTTIAAVDIYNSCSLLHSAPLGAYDTTLLPISEIALRPADPDVDSFFPLGGEAKDFPLKPSIIVYAAGHTVLCYGFNCRDSRLTALRGHTQDAIFCSELTNGGQRLAAENALNRLKELLSEAGAQTTEVTTVDRHHPETDLHCP